MMMGEKEDWLEGKKSVFPSPISPPTRPACDFLLSIFRVQTREVGSVAVTWTLRGWRM